MKTQKPTEIEKELNQTTNRLDELTEMRDSITTNLQTLQKGFVSGTTSLDNLQAEQGKLTTLDSSIESLEAKQDELHTAFQKASLSESRQTAIQQMEKLANESEVAFNDYLAMRAQTDAIFAEAAQKLVGKVFAWREKQFQFGAIARASGLTESEIKAVPNNEKATAVTFAAPELEYGVAISAAESILNSKLIKAAQAKEQTEFNERRFSRMDELPTARMSETENVLEYTQNA
jgi:cell division protein ZapA (FtsZ GTPase activity inhibitor)